MNWAVITILSLHFISLLINAYRHGDSKRDEHYNIWITLLATAIAMFLYYKTGMFN